mmetsp:Transcript_21880/g.44701  ORF Transcript_21880/g.44701 Transcript_21880/m.44701 type:complete len:235 (-) Transcript_21880:90-794(-)
MKISCDLESHRALAASSPMVSLSGIEVVVRPHEAEKSSSDLASHAALAASSDVSPHIGTSSFASSSAWVSASPTIFQDAWKTSSDFASHAFLASSSSMVTSDEVSASVASDVAVAVASLASFHDAWKSSSDFCSHAALAAASDFLPHCGTSCLASHAALAAASSVIEVNVFAADAPVGTTAPTISCFSSHAAFAAGLSVLATCIFTDLVWRSDGAKLPICSAVESEMEPIRRVL